MSMCTAYSKFKYYLYMMVGNQNLIFSYEPEIKRSPLIWVIVQAALNAEDQGFLPLIPLRFSLIPSWGL